MDTDRMRVLNMVAEAKITPEEADQLLRSLDAQNAPPQGEAAAAPKGSPKYLRVVVQSSPEHGGDKVNVRVPMNLIRAGVRLAALLPPGIYEKVNTALAKEGIDVDLRQIKPENLEELVSALSDLTVDVEGRDSVRVFCE